jgi:hypothetical protein
LQIDGFRPSNKLARVVDVRTHLGIEGADFARILPVLERIAIAFGRPATILRTTGRRAIF